MNEKAKSLIPGQEVRLNTGPNGWNAELRYVGPSPTWPHRAIIETSGGSLIHIPFEFVEPARLVQ